MNYGKIVEAKFIERENRFVARVECEGRTVRVHVKNTGRCRELLLPGSRVYLEDHIGRMGSRKMRYSLIAVEKEIDACGRPGDGRLLVNMDSQAPNKVVQEALADGRIRLPGMEDTDLSLIKPEATFGNSRFDFYVESPVREKKSQGEQCPTQIVRRAFIEVKGVTLEADGHARFPDAPTERGVKHIQELVKAREEGYETYIIFVVQMEGMKDVSPNYETHPEFGEALAKAAEAGVKILAYDCTVAPDRLEVNEQIGFVF